MCQVEDNTRPQQVNIRGPSLLLMDAVEVSTTVFFSQIGRADIGFYAFSPCRRTV